MGRAPDLPYASAGKRLGARLVDSLIMFGLAFVFWILLLSRLASSARSDTTSPLSSGLTLTLTFGFVVLTIALGFVNEIVLVALKGGSIGKLVLGIRIVKDDGSPAGWGTAFARYIPNLVSLVPVCGGLLAFVLAIANVIMVLGDPPRQSVYDKAGGTYVIDRI